MEGGQETIDNQQGQVTLLDILQSALNISLKMPPSKAQKNLAGLISLAPEIEDSLLEKVETPLQMEQPQGSTPFLKTEFNRDGDSYRSPFTNEYYPQADGFRPTGNLRKIEETGAVLFKEYTKLYYGADCVSNFYVAEGTKEGCLSCGFFAKKNSQDTEGFKGSWDSFNIVDIITEGNKAAYHLSSTVLIEMKITTPSAGAVDLTGFMKKSVLLNKPLTGKSEEDNFGEHLVTVGEMIEDNQTKLRMMLESVYIAKTKEVIWNCRMEGTVELEEHRKKLAEDLKNIRFKKVE